MSRVEKGTPSRLTDGLRRRPFPENSRTSNCSAGQVCVLPSLCLPNHYCAESDFDSDALSQHEFARPFFRLVPSRPPFAGAESTIVVLTTLYSIAPYTLLQHRRYESQPPSELERHADPPPWSLTSYPESPSVWANRYPQMSLSTTATRNSAQGWNACTPQVSRATF